MSDDYYFGNCTVCNRWKALKNGVCQECSEKKLPDFMEDFFGNIFKEKNEED